MLKYKINMLKKGYIYKKGIWKKGITANPSGINLVVSEDNIDSVKILLSNTANPYILKLLVHKDTIDLVKALLSNLEIFGGFTEIDGEIVYGIDNVEVIDKFVSVYGWQEINIIPIKYKHKKMKKEQQYEVININMK